MEVQDFHQPCVGAPTPLALADEQRTVLAYLIQEVSGERTSAKDDFPRKIALITFNLCLAQMWGPPNDEAFGGHPLAKRGLQPYAVSRVENSSWIRQLERMNSVHPRHQPETFWKKQHLIFAFHDSTFECVCGAADVKVIAGDSIVDVLPQMVKLLRPK
jgi:hypothetical protein